MKPPKAPHVCKWGSDGHCEICGRHKGGRPRKVAAPAPATTGQATRAANPAPVRPERDEARAARLAVLFPPEPAPSPAPEPERKASVNLKHSWPWIAKRTAGAVDVVTGIAIDRWAGREPLAAGEAEREEFEANLAEYGEQKLGRIEAPLWIVLLTSLGFFVASKYIGAPQKPKPLESKPAGKLLSMPLAPSADAADSPAPAAASDAASPVTVPPATIPPPPETEGDGSAQDAPTGF